MSKKNVKLFYFIITWLQIFFIIRTCLQIDT